MNIPSRTGTLPAPGVYEGIPDAEYRSWPALSQSDLKKYLESPRALQRSLDGVDEYTPSESQVVGQLVHTQLLEPDRYAAEFVATDQRRTDKLRQQHSGKTLVTKTQSSLAAATAEAIAGMPNEDGNFRSVIARGQPELSIVWDDPDTGLPCKGRIDLYDPVGEWIYDIKTTSRKASQDDFARQCVQFGYHIQARFYKRGMAALKRQASRFVFIAAETAPPHGVGVWYLDSPSEAFAAKQIRECMQGIKACVDSGSWRGYNMAEGVSEAISLPPWGMK